MTSPAPDISTDRTTGSRPAATETSSSGGLTVFDRLPTLRGPGSALLHRVDNVAARPLIAIAVITVDAVWVVLSVALEFPGRLETVFQTLVAALTLAMVFVIQHTQAKLNVATQRKLDEILHALPGADNALISLEQATHDELQSATETHQQVREAALDQ